ncbi:MAG: NAD(+)--dinitrogen-reductase ADP-D-ribosyltransferase [Rhodocyclaceae bacterium]
MSDKAEAPVVAVRLPRGAHLPINRCNLPAVVLGSLTFQEHPSPLIIDGVAELHRSLFDALAALTTPHERAERFIDYMAVHFRLEHLDEAGLAQDARQSRANANYLRILRGWAFDADGREGAVLKGWVESRFGLLTRHHGAPLRDQAGEAYAHFLSARTRGLYCTNAVEAQLDLVYTYCQYELHREPRGKRELPSHIELHRGVNRLADHEQLEKISDSRRVVLLNNLNSFSASRERAGEFGDFILTTRVPLPKIFCKAGLLPGVLKAEGEHVVLGGLYEVELSSL